MNTALYLVRRRLNEGWTGLIVWTTDLVRSDREMRLKVSSECDTDVPGCLSTGEHLVLAHVGLVSISVHYRQSTQLTTHTATQFVLQLITVQYLHCKWDTNMSHHILSSKPVRSCLLQMRLSCPSIIHSFISGMHHQDRVVPNVDISLQNGRFWATSRRHAVIFKKVKCECND